jgi:putative drug exporter of the RND superfamily
MCPPLAPVFGRRAGGREGRRSRCWSRRQGGQVPGVRVVVGGETANTVDYNTLLGQRTGWVFAFVLLLAFVILLISFRSLVSPAMSVVLNLLSVGAAYGVVVALFQWG